MKLLTDDDFGLNDRVRVGRERLCGKCSLIIVDIHVLRACKGATSPCCNRFLQQVFFFLRKSRVLLRAK